MTAQALIQRMQQIQTSTPATETLSRIMDELATMTATAGFSVTYTEANNPNTVPVYSAEGYSGYSEESGHQLVGAHVTFKDDFPSFVHELTHARCIQCYNSETVNYAPTGTNSKPLVFGKGAMPGAPPHTVSLKAESIIARRKAWYRSDYQAVLEGNLARLKLIAEGADYSDNAHDYMSRQQKRELKAAPASVEQMNSQQQLSHEMQYQGRVAKTLRTWKAATENTRRLTTEAERKKRWILERINYGKNGMGGLGDVHFEYDTVVNQMLVQMYGWGFSAEHDLFTAIATLAEETHQRRVSAASSGVNRIPAPRAVLT